MKRVAALMLILSLAVAPVRAAGPFDGKPDDEIAAQIDAATQGGKMPAGYGAALVSLLNNPDAGIRSRERAAWALGQFGYKPGVPALLKAAEHKGLLIRSAALGALARLRPAEALPTFVHVAESDPILQLRQRATIALGTYRSEKAIDPLVKLSSDPAPEIRGASALAMAMTHSKKNDFSEVLTEMAGDENPYVKERAERGLEIIHAKTSEVLSALKTGDADVRLAAAVHLEKAAGARDLTPLKEAWNGEADDDVRAQLERTIVVTKKRVAAEKKAAQAAAASGTAGKTSHKSTRKKSGSKHPAKKPPVTP